MRRNKNKTLPYIFFPPILHRADCLSWKRCHDSAGRMRFLCFHICKGWGKLVFFPPIFSVLVVYQLLPNTLPTIRPKAPRSRTLYCCYTQLCWQITSLFSPNLNTQAGPRWLLTLRYKTITPACVCKYVRLPVGTIENSPPPPCGFLIGSGTLKTPSVNQSQQGV